MDKPLLILTVGISASGKTTWCTEFTRNRGDFVDLNRDEFRFALFNGGVRNWQQYKFTRANEQRVTNMIDQLATEASIQRSNIVVSDTNLNHDIRKKWLEWSIENDYHYIIKEFPISYEEALKRDNQRYGGVGHNVLWSQWLKWLEYIDYDFYVPNLSKPKAVIIDVDGTIADMNGRKPYDWNKVDQDLPRKEVISMIHGIIEEGVTPIFLSGRDAVCKDKTYTWIMDNVMSGCVPENGGFHLFMRSEGDMKKDTIIKKELFDSYIRNNFNVVSAIDDRPCIVRLWTQMKIPNVISVADQLKEF